MTDYRILGPVEVSADGRVIEIGGPRLRRLLAILLLHANEPVPRGILVRDLWGDRPPAGAQGSLEVYISRLRKALGSPVLLTRPGAYCLMIDDGQLDARRFERLVGQGRSELAANKPGPAAVTLRAALELWRGPTLGDLGGESFAQVEAGRLEELRLGATEDRIEADLALGRQADVVGELEALVTVHPLRERLHGQLMLALYRGGRQAEALGAYRAARQMMVRELGLDPGPALQRLEGAILRQDPALDPPETAAPPGRDPDPPIPDLRTVGLAGGAPRPRNRRTRLAAIVATGAGVLVASLLIGFRGPAAGQATLAGASGLVAVNTASDQLVHATKLAGAPGAVSGGSGSVWVADPGGGRVSRVDPGSGAEVDRILVGGGPGSITSGAGAIWVASTVGATVTRIDPATEAVTQTIPLPGANPGAIAYGAGGLWVADPVARELFEVDPGTGSLRRTLPLDLQPSALAAVDGALWVAGYDSGTIEKVDPASGRATGRVHVGNGPVALAAQAGSLWVANSLDATVSRVDPAALAVTATIPVGSGPAALAAGAGSVWVANRYAGTVSRIDPGRNRAVASLTVGGSPTSLITGRGRLWVAVAAEGGGHRGGTLTIATTDTLDTSAPATSTSIDPAFFYYRLQPACLAGWPTTTSSPSSAAPARTGCGSSPTSRWPSRRRPRRHDVRLPDPSRHPVLRRPAAAGQRLPPRDRAPVPGRIPGPLAVRRPGRRRRVRRPPARLRPVPRHRHRRRRRDGHLPPHRARPRVPVQADRVFLLGADPARNAGPRARRAHGARHRAVPDRARQPDRDPVRPQPAVPRVVLRRPADRQS